MWHDMDPYNWLNKFYNFYMRATVGIIIVDVALELKHLTKTSLWYKSAATSTWYTWNTCVARMSSALKMQCYVWTCKACVYDCMSVHTLCRHLFIAITAHSHNIHYIFDWACKNQPCERELHWVIFSLKSLVPSVVFHKLQKKAHLLLQKWRCWYVSINS